MGLQEIRKKISWEKVIITITVLYCIGLTFGISIAYTIQDNKHQSIIQNMRNITDEKVKVIDSTINNILEQQEKCEEQQQVIINILEEIKTAKAEQANKQSQSNSADYSSHRLNSSLSEYQEYAKDLCLNTYNWTEYDFECLVQLWNKESGWDPDCHNSSSGAHGIPQSLPASKMASEGDDYYTNGYTQIRWGLKYILNRYGTPADAWSHFTTHYWY